MKEICELMEKEITKKIEDSLLKAFGMNTTTCTSTYATDNGFSLSQLKNTIREIQKNQIYIKIDDYIPNNDIIMIDWEKFKENFKKDDLLIYHFCEDRYEDKYYGKQFSMNSATAKKLIEGYPEMRFMVKNIEKLK